MATVNINLEIRETINTDVHVSDVVQAINDLPMKNRWNCISQIINGVKLSLSDLTEEQREVIKTYLNQQLNLF